MKLAIWNTSRVVTINGVVARLWEGTTDQGVKVHCLITTIAAEDGADLGAFDRDMDDQRPPSRESAFAFQFSRVVHHDTPTPHPRGS